MEDYSQPSLEGAQMSITLITAITAVKEGLEILKGAVSARDDSLIRNAEIALQEKLSNVLLTSLSQVEATHSLELEAQQLRMQVQSLTEQVNALKAKQEERGRYQLAQVGQIGRVYAYELRSTPEAPESEPHHYLCQPCFDQGKKGVLADQGPYLSCPLCQIKLQVRPAQYVQRRAAVAVKHNLG